MITMEVWKDIKGYEGIYKVSNLGRVKSSDRMIHYGVHGDPSAKCFRKGRILREGIQSGYKAISLSKEGKVKRCLIHRLVAESFVPNPNNYPEVNHRDEDKLNNRADNLEWCTKSYNINFGNRNNEVRKKFSKPVIGVNIKNKSVIRFNSIGEAKKYGYSAAHISSCCLGKRVQHKGYRWCFVKK